ncbi:hypothetical protein [Brachyspira aalborgi]|uniref:Uncharacterized protein n=1 Tax=Brachyspira aalborgi TaxID=29522 RepID=A0A5C8FVS5_9SPIR|nr:hypothetical protein [Brachyspira aalborgi]TXJ53746.1 hypothetical protein EPJ76_10025 [Brachyspira aalborgi]
MKNKIISIIFIILLIISCRKSRDITGDNNGGNNGVNNGGNNAGNNGGGNNGNFRFTKDNYEPPQTNTAAAKQFLIKFNEMRQKYPKGELMAYYRNIKQWHFTIDSGYKKYYFDSEANITNIYINGSGDKATNCIFWGMLPDNTNIACYYYKKNDGTFGVFNSLMYENGLIKDKVHFFTGTGIDMDEDLLRKSMDAVLKKTDNGYYDYKGTNTSKTTEANDNWKSKVTNKIIEEKDVVNTYTFLDNGDIKVETRDNKTYTLNFWGATNYYNDLLGIYYIKIDLKDIFGIIAPNESTYFYYGYVLEYEGRFPKAIERGQDSFYITNSINWYEKNFDINGKPKGTIDWGNMLIQESRYTSPITTKDIILFKK